MQDDQDLRAKLEAAIAQGQHLRDEVQQLKAILAQHSIPFPEPKTCEPASHAIPSRALRGCAD